MRLELLVVTAVDRVGCGEDGSSRIERGRDSSLGNRNGLLLHDLVDIGPVSLVHLVELINAANTRVCQNEGSSLEHNFSSVGVLEHCGGQSDSGGAFASGVNSSGGKSGNVLQQLGLGDAGVSHEEGVEMAPDFESIAHLLGNTANHEEEEGLLDFLHAEDFGADGGGHHFEELLLGAHSLLEALDLGHHLLAQHVLLEVLLVLNDLEALYEGVVHEPRPHGLET
mmetsp:Transcript_645/g.1217  ORF Transcript_645/g.1217 Transcript_645/m.1217 type:complete len:225 (+) Transcript_645:775-1449(+)